MALKHVLMALLAYNPSSGYSLHKMFFEPTRPMLSQIYRALNELLADGLVEFDRVHQTKLPARNVFYLTDAGRDELRRWISEPAKVMPIRAPFLQRVWFGSMGNRADILDNIKLFKKAKEEEIEFYNTKVKKIAEKTLKKKGSVMDKLYYDVVLDYIALRAKAELKWAEAAIGEISNFNPAVAEVESKKLKRRMKRGSKKREKDQGKAPAISRF